MRVWESLAWVGLLLICLVAGVGLDQWLGPRLAPEPVIGLVRFEATIETANATQLVNLLEAARQDRRVAAVVMEINSPGGLATSSETVFYTMLRLRAEKPLLVVIDGMAVSGGYYMAAAGNRIYTAASAYVGNIGTRGPRPDDPTLTPDELSSGPYKLAGGSRFDRVRQLELVAEAFVDNVITQRQNAEVNPLKIDKRTVEEARIYLGSEAVAIGLADLEGGRSDAIQGAAELAGLTRYAVVDLSELEGIHLPRLQTDILAAVKAMVETAPPDAVFLLDARVPLPGLDEDSEVVRHLLRLRGLLPAATATPIPVPANEAAPTLPEGGSE